MNNMLTSAAWRGMIRGMNKLPTAKRAAILTMLCEGASMRSVSCMADVSINTVAKLLQDAGETCAEHHDEAVRGVKAKRVQCDGVWSFCYGKQKNVAAAKTAPADAGDVWTWTALDTDSKLIVSYLIGGRDAGYVQEFMQDVTGRLANRVQFTTDGHKAHLMAVDAAFGVDVDYAMLEKIYDTAPESAGRYSPAECVGAKKKRVEGRPDPAHISTSYAGLQSLTMRMHMHRFTWLTKGASKKALNHAHMVALYTCWYNWIRIHKMLHVTPAMAVGLADRPWCMEDVVARIDAREESPAKRAP